MNKWLSMAHIPGAISISDEITISKTQTKLIALWATNKFQTISEKGKDVLARITRFVRNIALFAVLFQARRM